MKKYDYICDFNLKDCLKTLGIDKGGRVQQAVDDTFIKGVEPFTPRDEGRLYDSAIYHTIVGSGEIVFDVDHKARRLYYHPEYEFHEKGGSEEGGIGRGGYWAERYIQNGGREQIERAARKKVRE